MRLFELQTLRQAVPPLMVANLPKYMLSHGFVCLGMGVYGSVYRSEKYGYVIKLFSRADRGYQAFLKFALASGGNPHLPKFRGKFKTVNEKYMACRMEPLDTLSTDEQAIFDRNQRYLRFARRPIEKEEFVRLFQTNSQIDSSFIDLLADLEQVRQQADVSWDLHGGNVMKRGSTLVITDAFI